MRSLSTAPRCASIVRQQSSRLDGLQSSAKTSADHQFVLKKAKAGIRRFRLRTMTTAITIIATFLGRMVYDALSAVARFEPESSCNTVDRCDPCQPILVLLNHVLVYTPVTPPLPPHPLRPSCSCMRTQAIQSSVSLLSEPVTARRPPPPPHHARVCSFFSHSEA